MQGTKTLQPPPFAFFQQEGHCGIDFGGGETWRSQTTLSYDATISTGEGDYRDTGTAADLANGTHGATPINDRTLFASNFVVSDGVVPVNSDGDGDGVSDDEDNCANDPNPDQADLDNDGEGDACDNDLDGDGVPNADDNCATTSNPDQKDTDGDGIGDECDPQPGSSAGCKVTGGGHIIAPNGDKATFGVVAQAKDANSPKGNATYIDHAITEPLRFKSLTTDSVICDGNRVTIRGTGDADGEPVDYRIDVTDNGEPGRNDTYRIQLSNGHDSGERPLQGGNAQVG